MNYASTSNIGEVIKFYDLGDKTFETDFRDYSFIKPILAVRPIKTRGREEMRTVCDIEITETLCVYFNIGHPVGFHQNSKLSYFSRGV